MSGTMTPGYDDTPRPGRRGARDAAQGSTASPEHSSLPDTPPPPWDTHYMETSLLRALMRLRYSTVLTLCAGHPVESLLSEPYRLILRTLLHTATDAVAAGAGDRDAAPQAVVARLQDMGGPESVAALQGLPEVLHGEVSGHYAGMPSADDVPRLWSSVERARVYRAMDTQGRSLVGAAQSRDASLVAESLRRCRFLLQIAVDAGVIAPGDDGDQDAGNSTETGRGATGTGKTMDDDRTPGTAEKRAA